MQHGMNNIALPAWLIGVLAAWAVSFEVGAAATLGYAAQWALKAPQKIANWVAPAVVVVVGYGLYGYVLGHRPDWPISREWVSEFVTWTGAALGIGSASGHTGGAPKTNSL